MTYGTGAGHSFAKAPHGAGVRRGDPATGSARLTPGHKRTPDTHVAACA